MKLPIWVHQVQTSYLQSPLGASDVGLPFSAIYGKAADGLNFMSTWDSHPSGVDGLAAVVMRDKAHEAEGGREYIPWVVPRGAQPSWSPARYIEKEAQLAAQIALAGAGPGETPVVILDLEPHYHGGATPQFWRSDLMSASERVTAVRQWVARFHSLQPDGEIWLAVDAREPHLTSVQFSTWLDAMESRGMQTRIMPMIYWTDFQIGARAAIGRALSLLEGIYKVQSDDIEMIYPGNSSTNELLGVIEWAHTRGTRKPSIWQRVNLSKANADAIAAMEDPWDKPVAARALDMQAVRQVAAGAYRAGQFDALAEAEREFGAWTGRRRLALRGEDIDDATFESLLP